MRDATGLKAALQKATPGTRVLLAPGEYAGGLFFSNLSGAAGKPIVIAAADPASPPHIRGGAECLHLSDVTYLELRDLLLTGGTRTPSDALVGPLAVAALRSLHVDWLFLGVHGVDERAGLTTPNLVEAETNRALIAA